MRFAALAALTVLAVTSRVEAAPIVTYSDYLPPSSSDIYAPVPTSTSNGTYLTSVGSTDAAGSVYVGLTQTYPGIARSPFEGVSGFENAPFDSVSGGGFACFGSCTLGGIVHDESVVMADDAPPSLTSFSFIYGSPDTYNTLTLYTDFGSYTLSGSSLTSPNPPSQSGYEYVTISGVGNIHGAEFASSANAFEFAAVSAVPLPASAPMFGAALVALGAIGYGLRRKKAMAAA